PPVRARRGRAVTAFSIVVVLHDSEAHLRRLLDSLDRHLPGQAHVIAVDTESTDAGVELARERGALIVEVEGNPGFGVANNAGIVHARHDVTALLNPDVELLDDGLPRLVDRARQTTALLAPRLLNPDGTTQDSVHPRPGRARELLPALVPRGPGRPWRSDRRKAVGWATAAALVARTEVLRGLGPFDPDAFLWYEDLDLCLRAEAVEHHPDVALLHAGGHSTGDDLEARARRRREVVGARLGPRALAWDDLAQAITFARAAPFRARPRAQLRALRAARGRRGA
ncbi:MAG TPA: glycosyltransferase, partial [Solirubrobacteraceae bacterium]